MSFSNGTDALCHGMYTASFDPPTTQSSSHPASKSKSTQKKPQPAPGTRHITRNRASYSCHACRRRKVKCDKVHPICSNCVKTGDECTYDATSSGKVDSQGSPGEHGQKRRRTNSPHRDGSCPSPSVNGWDHNGEPSNGRATGSKDRHTIEARLDRLTSMVETLTKGNGYDGLESPGELEEAFSVPKTPEDNARLHPGSWHHRSGSSKNSRSTSSERTGDGSQPADLIDPMCNLNLGHLSIDSGGRSRYVGTTFWAYISDEITELNQLLRDQNKYFGATTPVNGQCQGHQSDVDQMERDEGTSSITGHEGTNGFHKQVNGRSGAQANINKAMLFQTDSPFEARFKRIYADMLIHVPTKKQSHALYRCFFSGVHLISPLVHPPTVLKQYESFWDWYERYEKSGEREEFSDPSFIPLLYAIWYGGSVSIPAKSMRVEFGNIPRAVLSAKLHDEVTRTLTLISFPKIPSLPGLTAFLIVQTILVKEEEPLTSSLFVGLALRVGQTMGLHRDPAQFGIEAREAEVRRRNWWHIIYMDSVVALSSGLPPQVSDESYWDVKPINEIKDKCLGTREAKEYEDAVTKRKRSRDNPDEPLAQVKSSMVNVSFVANQGKYAYAFAMRKILKIQLGTKPLEKKDMEDLRKILQDLETKLNERIKRIPARGIPELGFTPGNDEKSKAFDVYNADPEMARSLNPEEVKPWIGVAPVDGLNDQDVKYHFASLAAFHNWGRILLSLLIDKAYCVAYQPFLKNAKSKLWPPARQCALRHCHGFMRKFIQLASDPQFQPFTWSWPGSHQPMHATMIMLIDLYERPNSVEAPRSRALIDKVFSLSSPEGGIVSGEDGVSVQRPLREGGREAWYMLRRLRQKAWQRAGLDPDVLWTEQDQIQAGVAQPPSSGELMLRAIRENTIYSKEPGSALNNASSKGTSLDAFNGLLKAAQNDIEAAEQIKARSASRQNSLPNTSSKLLNPESPLTTTSNGTSHPVAPPQQQQFHPRSSSFDFQQSNWRTPASNGATQPSSFENYTFPLQSLPETNQNGHASIIMPATDTLYNSPATATTISNPAAISMPQGTPGMMNGMGATGETPPMTTAGGILGAKDDDSPGFDWNQWDAVFGQYVPVDDFMDLDNSNSWSLGTWDGLTLG